MTFFKKAFLLLLSLIIFFSFAGCSMKNDSETLRVAEVTRSIFYAPFYAAMSQGFFEEEGINIDLTTTWGGDKTMTALLSDGADISLVGAETSIYVYAQEATDPAITFAALTQTDGTFLVSRQKLDSFEWEDLKGSVFLGQRKGGMPQMVGEHVLKKHGINPHQDLELIQNIDFGNIHTAFASGTGEFVQLFEPQATMFENEGIGHIVASFGTESGTVPYTGFMAKQSMIEEEQETLERFTRALYKGQQWVEEQPAEVIAEAILDFFEDTPVELVTQVVDRYKSQGSYATSPLVKPEAWDNLQLIMDQAGELPQPVDYETLVNTTIAENVMK
ncbi:ABC transporter substrate-binding protein [Halalkalibacter nanhaiisediminis]|uniref:NitT/TauT family transport system substrate-binding protein n=1 Tax=Halalkalibacter nanhaiisediminis TaxID=688079 RepID=A0A562QL18_9BACI|nr:ABC transporter substrate-binding protein [Halalkalibacter nanhaiisediminis]TWI56890.1 NitT/TauT family transport system substrate-binding protein [Halalkalibacter nanhaiisediminis]